MSRSWQRTVSKRGLPAPFGEISAINPLASLPIVLASPANCSLNRMTRLICLPPTLHRLLRSVSLAAALLWTAAASAASPALDLRADEARAQPWSVVSLLSDPSRKLTVEDVLARLRDFTPADGTPGNLGVRRDAVWLRFDVSVASGEAGQWILDIDYPSLDRVDVHVLTQGRLVQHAALGRALPFSERRLPSRTTAVELDLEPGTTSTVLLRVETTSSMVLPLSLMTREAFHAHEARMQMLQGLLTGIALCLLVFSLLQFAGYRDRLFLDYALTLAGTTLFFYAYFGLGPQHLWGDNIALATKIAPLAVMVALIGSFRFMSRALSVADIFPRLAYAMQAGSMVALVVALAFAVDLISYRLAHTIATVLGPLSILLAVPTAFVRARSGDRAAGYMLVAWAMYACGTLMMAALLRGFVEPTFVTQHAFQLGALLEMLLWMRVLALRAEQMREAAQRAHLERDALHSLAHTDPLTGLPNRRGLNAALQAALRNCAPDRQVAVYLLDLDGFKPVNDRLGHEAGDQLLVEVGKRLRKTVRATDVVARLGGDEFVVMASHLPSPVEADRLGHKLLEEMKAPFLISGEACRVGLTIGYTLAPLDGDDASALLRRADAAMYDGKNAGRNCLRRAEASPYGAG